MADRNDALEAARRGVEAHQARADREAIRTIRLVEDLKDAADDLDQRLEEWPDPPASSGKLRDRIRSEIGKLEARLDDLVQEIAPNLHHLLGPNLAALLMAEAGGLADLARRASTTVQVLGARRAVLRARKGAKPPKHGVIFLHPKVAEAPRDRRGDNAKQLARLVVLAARADALTGRDVRDEIDDGLGSI